MKPVILGIDPGLYGALARFEPEKLVYIVNFFSNVFSW